MSKKIVLLAALGFLNSLSWGAESFTSEELTVTILNIDALEIKFKNGGTQIEQVFNCHLFDPVKSKKIRLKELLNAQAYRNIINAEEMEKIRTERNKLKDAFNIDSGRIDFEHAVWTENGYWFFYPKIVSEKFCPLK